MNRLMGIDYGNTRVGIAITDPLRITTSGFATLINDETLLENIKEIVIQKEISEIVVGLPYDQNSEIGPQARIVIDFISDLVKFLKNSNITLRIYEQDERYSTIEAKTIMKSVKVKNKNIKKELDQVAACGILRDFMNSRTKKELVLPDLS